MIAYEKGTSLQSEPIVGETSEDDFTAIIKGKDIKGMGEAFIYININLTHSHKSGQFFASINEINNGRERKPYTCL